MERKVNSENADEIIAAHATDIEPTEGGIQLMRYDISGSVMQTVSVQLQRSEQVYSQTAAMAWMTDGIVMDTHTGGGLFAGLKRAMSGGSLFITDFTAEQPGEVAFAPRFPGKILASATNGVLMRESASTTFE